MEEVLFKCILIGIFLCLIYIAFNIKNNQDSLKDVEKYRGTERQIIQVNHNRILVVANKLSNNTVKSILVFDYEAKTNEFICVDQLESKNL